jgi:hypothetical protein
MTGKIINGLKRACEKRPVSINTIEAIADRVERNLQERGEKEIPSSMIGETVMRELHDTDPVAYVRFASVYRSFKDINEFMVELEELISERKGAAALRTRPLAGGIAFARPAGAINAFTNACRWRRPGRTSQPGRCLCAGEHRATGLSV